MNLAVLWENPSQELSGIKHQIKSSKFKKKHMYKHIDRHGENDQKYKSCNMSITPLTMVYRETKTKAKSRRYFSLLVPILY